MAKEYKHFLKNVNKTLGQCGAMEKHFTDALADLKDLSSNNKEKYFRAAERNLSRANKAGRRVSQHFKDVKEDIEAIKKDENISQDNKIQLQKFEEIIRPHEAALTVETSYFLGRLGKDVEKLRIQLQLYQKGKEDYEDMQDALNTLVQGIKDIIADPKLGTSSNVGLLPFTAEIKKKLLPLAKRVMVEEEIMRKAA